MARDGIGFMHIFVIDAENRITAHAGTKPVHLPRDGCRFADAKELTDLIAGWPLARLVEIWNKLPNAKRVSRFADRRIAARRIWGGVQQLRPARTKQRGIRGRGRSLAKTDPSRDGTKTEKIIALLKRPSGATINDIVAETGWQPHSVRGFISGQLSKRLRFRIKSFKGGGERVYRIMEGKTA
jgi:hypothetical protein